MIEGNSRTVTFVFDATIETLEHATVTSSD